MSTINRVNGITGTAVANAVTMTGRFGKITTEALTPPQRRPIPAL